MANADEIQKRGREAQETFIRQHLVAIDQDDADGKRFIGSATCIQIGNHNFLCTAAHNFKGIPKGGKVTFVSTYPEEAKITLTVVDQNYSDHGENGTLDAAWVEIGRESAVRSRVLGVALDAIDPYHIVDMDAGNYLMVGLPADFYKLTGRPVRENIPLLAYFTKPGKQANEMDDRLLLDYASKTVRLPDELLDMPHPGGISGGGIWSVPKLEKSEVWSPHKYRLVGLNTDYLKVSRQIVGMKMYHWLRLVLNDHPELREYIEPVLKRKQVVVVGEMTNESVPS